MITLLSSLLTDPFHIRLVPSEPNLTLLIKIYQSKLSMSQLTNDQKTKARRRYRRAEANTNGF